VRNPLVVEELKSIGDITYYKAGLVLSEVHPLLNVRQKWSAIHFLEDQVEFGGLLEELDQLDDIAVGLAVVEDLDLPEHPRPVMAGDLVDHFHGILLAGVVVFALLYGGVGALSQEFAGQGVEVGEGVGG